MRAAVSALALFVTLVEPPAAAAQQAGRVYRVGNLGVPSRESSAHLSKAFEEGLREQG